jgi:acyl carrier protein
MLEAVLRQQLARVLGLVSPEVIERDRPLHDMGVDSLMATELRTRLEGQLSVSLGAALIFNYPTLDALVRHLIADVLQLATDGEARAHGASAAGREAPASDEGPSEIAALNDDEVERRLARSVDRILGASDAGLGAE